MDTRNLTITTLDTVGQISRACAVIDAVWGSSDTFGVNHMRAVQHAGGYVSGAILGERMIGASVGFLGRGTSPDGDTVATLHSHITGVLPEFRGAGTALKQHQQEWCHQRGIEAITWTFDPLVARNAYFNVAKLGATVRGYLVDHYGPMHDGINTGEPSDRLDVWWPVAGALVARGIGPHAPAGVHLLRVDPDGGPQLAGDVARDDGRPLLVQVPADIETLRRVDPDMAARWRPAVRDTLGTAMAAGRTILRVDRSGTYHVSPR